MAKGVEEIVALPDPVGGITDSGSARPVSRLQDACAAGRGRHHLRVATQRDRRRRGAVPQGRQRDESLRGGSEAQQSNAAIAACVQYGLRAAGLPETAVQVVATTDRAAVGHLIATRGTST